MAEWHSSSTGSTPTLPHVSTHTLSAPNYHFQRLQNTKIKRPACCYNKTCFVQGNNCGMWLQLYQQHRQHSNEGMPKLAFNRWAWTQQALTFGREIIDGTRAIARPRFFILEVRLAWVSTYLLSFPRSRSWLIFQPADWGLQDALGRNSWASEGGEITSTFAKWVMRYLLVRSLICLMKVLSRFYNRRETGSSNVAAGLEEIRRNKHVGLNFRGGWVTLFTNNAEIVSKVVELTQASKKLGPRLAEARRPAR